MTGLEPVVHWGSHVCSAAYMANKTLGEVIRNARMALDMTLRELARRLAVTPSYVSDIENDRRVPSEDVLGRIATELGLDPGDLVARAGRLGNDAEKYMRQTPAATTLFRRVSKERLNEGEIEQLLQKVDELRNDRSDDEESS